jgi:hypothetical protein
MKTFEPGKTYFGRSVCDHDCIFKITVAKRTPKTITTTKGETFRIKLFDSGGWEESEGIFLKQYSMAPIILAAKEQK